MKTYTEKIKASNSNAVANSVEKTLNKTSPQQFMDNRPASIAQRKMQDLANSRLQRSNVMYLQRLVNRNMDKNVYQCQSDATKHHVQSGIVNMPIVQLKRFLQYNQMYYGDDFSERHLSNNLDDAFNKSVTRCNNDTILQSSVIVANSALKRNLLKDFADDYNRDEHGEHDNIVYTRPVTVVHTEFTEEYETGGIKVKEYETQQWDGVYVGVGLGLAALYLGEIGHLDRTLGGNKTGSTYRTSFLDDGTTDWFREI
jgi:hypothetical protein